MDSLDRKMDFAINFLLTYMAILVVILMFLLASLLFHSDAKKCERANAYIYYDGRRYYADTYEITDNGIYVTDINGVSMVFPKEYTHIVNKGDGVK